MFAHELYEQNKPRVIVTYPGRFQPFHQGHAEVFAQLQKKFGADNVFIITSNDTSSAKSPFNFADKYQLITAAGIAGNHIVETNKMYVLPDGIDPANTVFIAAVGGPDADRLRPDSVTKRDQKDEQGNIIKPAGSPGYYKTWGIDPKPVTADKHGYVIVIPEVRKSITIKGKEYDVSHGTECRNLWNAIRNDQKSRQEFLGQMYRRPSAEIAAIYDKIPQSATEDIVGVSSDTSSPIPGRLEEMGGVGVIASKRQAKDPRYSNSLTKDVRPGAIEKNLKAFRLAEDEDSNKLALAALDFYKNQVGNIQTQPVDNYTNQAKQLLARADSDIKPKVLDILKKGQKNPYLQGGIITTVGALLAGGLLASAQQMNLNPTQTNMLLQAVLNTVIPTMVSRVNGKSWIDTIKYTLASAGIGTGIAAVTEQQPTLTGKLPMVTPPGLKSPQQQAAAQLGHGEEELEEKWTKKYKQAINCNNPKGFSQRAHCAGRRARQAGHSTKSKSVSEDQNNSISKEEIIQMLSDFLPMAAEQLNLKKLPQIIIQKHVETHDGQATFGRFVNDEVKIYIGIADRHPVDILRTLAHELVHFKQFIDGKMYQGAGETGTPIENQANAVAGIIMRNFNKKYPDAVKSKPLELQ